MSSFLNKITKKDLLTYFEVDEQLLSKDVIDFLDKLFPIGGISGKVIEISAEKYGNRKLTRYRLSIARPAYGGLQSVKLKIKDKYGVLNEYENEFEYLD